MARDRKGWHRLPGREHASPTGLFQEAGGRPRGAGGGLCASRRAGEPGWVWVPRGRVEARVRFRAPREGGEAQAGPGQGLRKAFFGEGGPGVPGGREVKALAGERARCATLTQVRAAPPAEVPGPPRAFGRSLCSARRTGGCACPPAVRSPRPRSSPQIPVPPEAGEGLATGRAADAASKSKRMRTYTARVEQHARVHDCVSARACAHGCVS